MKILLLSPNSEALFPALRRAGDAVDMFTDKLELSFLRENVYDFIVSYGYRHIIRPEVLSLLKGNVINLHISYLPYNRGADPNFWSWYNDTPKGVTIHYVDEGIDTGDIIYRKRVLLSENNTLKTSYDILHQEIIALFDEGWEAIRQGQCPRHPQNDCEATSYRTKDKKHLWEKLPLGYDTPVSEVVALGK